jgi:hypothetical protein
MGSAREESGVERVTGVTSFGELPQQPIRALTRGRIARRL